RSSLVRILRSLLAMRGHARGNYGFGDRQQTIRQMSKRPKFLRRPAHVASMIAPLVLSLSVILVAQSSQPPAPDSIGFPLHSSYRSWLANSDSISRTFS